MSLKNSFVSVRTRYYKFEPALAVIDHVKPERNGFTRSANVKSSFSKNNSAIFPKGYNSSKSVLDAMCIKYQKTTGKKVRSDFNILFEHIVVLSEEQYSSLELKYGDVKAKKMVMKSLKSYASAIKEEFGFAIISVVLHLDEGRYDYDTNKLIRNVHAHINFFNYDFEKKKAPLRYLMKKGYSKDGKTNQLNPNFQKMQDLAAQSFSSLGFQRGISKLVTGHEHESKENYVRKINKKLTVKNCDLERQQETLQSDIETKNKLVNELNLKVSTTKKEFDWLKLQVSELYKLQNRLKAAIVSGCKNSLSRILKSAQPSVSKPNNL